MTGDDFAAWLEAVGLSQRQAAEKLGMSRNSVAKYLIEGAPVVVAYACAAIAADLPPWAIKG